MHEATTLTKSESIPVWKFRFRPNTGELNS